MTDEIEDYDEELHELEDEIARGIKQLNGLTSHEDKLKVLPRAPLVILHCACSL